MATKEFNVFELRTKDGITSGFLPDVIVDSRAFAHLNF